MAGMMKPMDTQFDGSKSLYGIDLEAARHKFSNHDAASIVLHGVEEWLFADHESCLVMVELQAIVQLSQALRGRSRWRLETALSRQRQSCHREPSGCRMESPVLSEVRLASAGTSRSGLLESHSWKLRGCCSGIYAGVDPEVPLLKAVAVQRRRSQSFL